VRVARARRRRNAEIVGAVVVGAAVCAGLVYFLTQRSNRDSGSVRPMMRRLRHNMADYVESARDAIDEAVTSELKDLRRSIRRQRRRLGV
jgi:hypothetical protein